MKIAITAKRAVMLVMTIGLAVVLAACPAATATKTQVTVGSTQLPDMSFTDFVAGTTAAKTVTITGSHFVGTNLEYKASSGDENVATAEAAGNVVTVTPKGAGTATVLVTASATESDEEGRASQSFTVTVTAPPDPDPEPPPDNNAPRLKAGKTLPHHTDLLFGGSEVVDLSEYFTDDEGDAIMYDADSTDEAVVTTSVSGSMLTITVVNHGDATIRVTATDAHNESTREAFDVTVINQAPMIEPDEPTRFGPYMPGDTQKITVSEYFTDVEGDSLMYGADSSDDAIVTVTDPDADSVSTITAVAVGTAMITITANDGNSMTSHTLTVTVSAVPNVAPEVTGDGIPDQSLQLVVTDMMESVTSEPIDLSMYFMDPDELPMPLTYSDDSDMTMIDGSMLTITASVAGKTMITVTASDGEASIPDEFYVMVTAPDAPTRTDESLGVQALAHDAEPMDIELDGYFEGATGYDAESDDTTVVMVSVSNSTLTLTPEGAGTALVTVTADNSGGEETLTFRVKVSDPAAVALPTNPTPIPPQKVVLGEPRTVNISEYFTGATSYRASGVAGTVTAEVTDAGMLTLTPVAHGTAEVRVIAINSAGEVSDDFTVTVQARPRFKMGKSLDDLRISLGGATAPVDSALPDLDEIFEDPDGSSLKYVTKTNDVKKVYVLTDTKAADVTADDTPAEQDAAVMAEGKDITLVGRAVGTATITVTVTDSDELSLSMPATFMVTVVAAANVAPTALAGAITSFTGDDRFKLGDEPKKAIDNKAINDYFGDTDLDGTPGDELRFRVEYSSGDEPDPDGTTLKVTVADEDKVADADRVAIATVMPDMWDGDPHGGEDKFTVTVTPTMKAGGPQRILIIATDLAGAEEVVSFQVAVNNPPKPEGLQEKPLMLSSFKEAEGLKSSSTAVSVPIFVADGGYFSDKDMTDDAATSDTLTCSFRPTVTGDTAPAALAWTGGNTATSTSGTITLTVTPKTTYSAQFVPMPVEVWCSDGIEETAKQTFIVSVTAQASIQ